MRYVGAHMGAERGHADERRFRRLVDTLDHAVVWEFDDTLRQYTFVSEHSRLVLGYDCRDWLSNPSFFEERIEPQDLPRVLEMFERLRSKQDTDVQLQHRCLRADGRVIWVHSGVHYEEEAGHCLFRGVTIDIDELKQVEERERAARLAAERTAHARDEVLAVVSHDLRNPLNTILAASTDLQSGTDYDAATQKRLLDLIIDETRRLDRIVDNLLGLSRLQAGALVPTLEPVAVSELVEHCRSRFALIGDDGDRLDVVEPVPDVDVDVDPVQIDQVLTNLVENSVRHAHAPVHVTVSVAEHGSMVEWRVCDDGPGFSPAARADLFRPFRSTGGSSGLGLTLCKAVVEAHGGTLTIDDSAGQGASIRFTVPRAR